MKKFQFDICQAVNYFVFVRGDKMAQERLTV